jgi:O-antigen ligase
MKSYIRVLFIGSLILFSFFIAQTLATRKYFIASLMVLCFTTTISCLLSLLAFAFSFTSFSFFEQLVVTEGSSLHRITGFLAEPGFFGAFLLITISLSFFLYRDRKSLLWGYSTLVQSITLILTFSRAALLAFSFGIFFVCLFYLYFHKEKIVAFLKDKRMLLFTLIFILFLLLALMFIAKTVVSNDMRWSTLIRLENSIYAIEAFTEHPLLGIGYENFAFYSGYRYAPSIFGIPGIYPSINNIILQVFTETGIIGAFIFFILIYVSIKMILKSLHEKKDWFYSIIFTGTSLFIQMLFFNLFSFIFLWVWVGLVLLTLEHKEILNDNYQK